MGLTSKLACILAVLFACALFGAQLHCCENMNSPTPDSHACPICSGANIAILTLSLTLEMAPAINRMEDSFVPAVIFLVVDRGIAPRAPPAS